MNCPLKSNTELSNGASEINKHPLDKFIRQDRMPHIWCPGCGLGTVFNGLLNAIIKSSASGETSPAGGGIDLDKIAIVSGIGCTGRIAGYVKFDGFHTTHGRAIPFATGLKLARPDLKVIVVSGEGDLFSIGGNHFIHAGRRNVDLTVICVNNSNYGMTGGQCSATTPVKAITATTPFGNFEAPFSLPHIAAAVGAVYVARWTAFHVQKMQASMVRAIRKKGFSFVEIMSPCPTYYARMNKLGSGLDMMKFYKENTVIQKEVQLKDISIVRGGKIVIGDFVDSDRPTFNDLVDELTCRFTGATMHKEEKQKLTHE
ncbi:MAG: 2-oxoacid:ferredoxin oxidoreductase subunit beta [Planctomycetes bacterium]|nr:2-oxoacid:ferredoxin oxidoreductase subunit beta [Planctomycetota bacterium]